MDEHDLFHKEYKPVSYQCMHSAGVTNTMAFCLSKCVCDVRLLQDWCAGFFFFFFSNSYIKVL